MPITSSRPAPQAPRTSVAVMSGNFTSPARTPAVAEKRLRAHMALHGGAIWSSSCPVAYAMAAAQRFAFGAVSIARAMGCVDMLSFGSSSPGYISLIMRRPPRSQDAPAVRELMQGGFKNRHTFCPGAPERGFQACRGRGGRCARHAQRRAGRGIRPPD